MMDEQVVGQPQYMVSIYESEDAGGPLVFTFVPKGPGRERGPNGSPGRVPQFIVGVRMESGAAGSRLEPDARSSGGFGT